MLSLLIAFNFLFYSSAFCCSSIDTFYLFDKNKDSIMCATLVVKDDSFILERIVQHYDLKAYDYQYSLGRYIKNGDTLTLSFDSSYKYNQVLFPCYPKDCKDLSIYFYPKKRKKIFLYIADIPFYPFFDSLYFSKRKERLLILPKKRFSNLASG